MNFPSIPDLSLAPAGRLLGWAAVASVCYVYGVKDTALSPNSHQLLRASRNQRNAQGELPKHPAA